MNETRLDMAVHHALVRALIEADEAERLAGLDDAA